MIYVYDTKVNKKRDDKKFSAMGLAPQSTAFTILTWAYSSTGIKETDTLLFEISGEV